MSFYKNIGEVKEINHNQIKYEMSRLGYIYHGTISNPERWCVSDFVSNLIYPNHVVLNLTDNMLYKCVVINNVNGYLNYFYWENLHYVITY